MCIFELPKELQGAAYIYIFANLNPLSKCWATCNKWCESYVGRLARMDFSGVFGQKIDTYRIKSTNKLIEYKMYLQALPYFDYLKGDYEDTK
jgi:hypothetical protein